MVANEQHFKVRVGERLLDVSVDLPHDGNTRVRIGDRTFAVRFVDSDTAVVQEADGTAQRTVGLENGSHPRWAVVDGNPLAVEVKTAQAAAAEALLAAAAGDASGDEAIRAPMPGRIVRVLVAVGDHVHAETPVVIVEAMKMENELRSSISGVVRAIAVQEGDTVEGGKVLCEIAAHADSEDEDDTSST